MAKELSIRIADPENPSANPGGARKELLSILTDITAEWLNESGGKSPETARQYVLEWAGKYRSQ